jgi:murein DD-endopeptidase MepM/ murein hydrolase activator NlpD
VTTDYRIARQYRNDYEIMKIGYEANGWAQGGFGQVIKKPEAINYVTGIERYNWKYSFLDYPIPSLKDSYVTCEKGPRHIFGVWEKHNGVDIVCLSDLRVVSMVGGVIEATGYDRYYGNYITIKSVVNYNDKLYNVTILYGHLSLVYGKIGQSVLKGAVIGVQGNTGRVLKSPGIPLSGVHLHISVILNGQYVNVFSNSIINRRCEP